MRATCLVHLVIDLITPVTAWNIFLNIIFSGCINTSPLYTQQQKFGCLKCRSNKQIGCIMTSDSRKTFIVGDFGEQLRYRTTHESAVVQCGVLN